MLRLAPTLVLGQWAVAWAVGALAGGCTAPADSAPPGSADSTAARPAEPPVAGTPVYSAVYGWRESWPLPWPPEALSDAWLATAGAQLARQASSVEREVRRNPYSWRVETLLSDEGPRTFSARHAAALQDSIETGPYRGLHGVHGPGVETHVDFNGDGRRDLWLTTGGSRTTHGPLYLRQADNSFRYVGYLDLEAYAVCPRGDGSADLYETGGNHVLGAYGALSRVSPRSIQLVQSVRVEPWDYGEAEAERRVLRRLAPYADRLNGFPGCYRPCDYGGELCYGGDASSNERDTTLAVRLPARSDSVEIRISSSLLEGSALVRLRDAQGRTRLRDTLSRDRRAAVFRAGAGRYGPWSLAVDVEARDDVSVSARYAGRPPPDLSP